MKINIQKIIIGLLLLGVACSPIQAQTQTDIRPLSVGQPIERELKGGEKHIYKVDLKTNEFFQITIEQKGIDVAISLFSPNGQNLSKTDSPNGNQGEEIVSWITSESGNYSIEIEPTEKKANIGKYSIKILVRAPTEKDRKLFEASILFAEGKKFSKENKAESFSLSLEKYGQAEKIYRQLEEKKLQATCLNEMGFVASLLSDFPKSLEYNLQALPLFRAVEDKNGESATLNDIGAIYRNLSQPQKALEFYNQALPLARSLGDKRGEVGTLNNIGLAHVDLGKMDEGLEFYNQALKLSREIEDKAGQALVLNNLGALYRFWGDLALALDFFNQALPLNRNIDDQNGQANNYNNIGAIYRDLGEMAKAIENYQLALKLYQKLGDKFGEAVVSSNMGVVYQALGELQKALEFYNLSLPIRVEIEDKRGECSTLGNIGTIYKDLGERQKSLEYLNQSLQLARKITDKRCEVIALNNIASVYADLKNYQKALEYHNLALPIRREIRDRNGESTTLNNIGLIYTELRENQKALEFFNQALSMRRAIGNKSGEAVTLNNIGAVYLNLGEPQKALEFYNQSLPLRLTVGDKNGEVTTLHNIMVAYQAQGKENLATAFGKQAVNLYQKVRLANQGFDKNLQKSLLKLKERNYRYLASLLIGQNRLAEAQQVLNSYKDEQLFDFGQSGKEITLLTLTPHEQEFENQIGQKLNFIEEQGTRLRELIRKIGRRKPTDEQIAERRKLETDLNQANEDYLSFVKAAELEFNKTPDKIGTIADLEEMRTALSKLQSQTKQKSVTLYPVVGEANFQVLIISQDKISAVSSAIKSEDVNKKIEEFLKKLNEVDKQTNAPKFSTSEVQKTGKELYDIVFAPVDAKLKELKLKPDVLMWSLDGALRYLPVAALYDGRQYLAERYQNVVFTRANAERMLAPVSATWTGSGFYNSKEYSLPVRNSDDGKMKLVGFDGLKNAKTEVETIFGVSPGSGIIGGDFLSDEQFTKESFFKALKLNRPLVHIASHFKFEAGDASASFLLLGDGTKLTLEDIKNAPDDLFKGVELLTLSACETGVQKERESDGREIDGFAELAQRKGAKSVMASLWKVDDESTSQLMTQFYQTRQTKKLTKAEALQTAQLNLLKSKDFSHPFYWSSFILIGNWR